MEHPEVDEAEVLETEAQTADEVTEEDDLEELLDELESEESDDSGDEVEPEDDDTRIEAEAAEGLDEESESTEEPADHPESETHREPFQFKVDGETIAIENGSIYQQGDDPATRMIVMPEASFAEIHKILGHRRKFSGQISDLKAELQTVEDGTHPLLAEANVFRDKFVELIEDEDKLVAFIQNLPANADALKARAELAAAKAGNARYTSRESARNSEARAVEEQRQIADEIPALVDTWLDEQNVQLSKTDRALLERELYDDRDAFYFRVGKENPYGLEEGAIARNGPRMAQRIERFVTLANRSASPKTVDAKTATQTNQRVLQKRKRPPTTVATGSAPAEKEEFSGFETKEDYQKWLRSSSA